MGLVLLHIGLFVFLTSGASYVIRRNNKQARDLLLQTHEENKKRLEVERAAFDQEVLAKMKEAQTIIKQSSELTAEETAKKEAEAYKLIQDKIDAVHAEYELLETHFRDSMKEDATLNLITCAYAVASKNLNPRAVVDSDLTMAVMRHRNEAGPAIPRKALSLFGDKKIYGTYN